MERKSNLATHLIRSLFYFFAISCSLTTRSAYGQSDSNNRPRWLIVTTGELAIEIEPLVLRRQKQGFEIFKVVRDGQLPSSDWNSEFIRNKISEICQEPNRSTYVLLVGDWNENSKHTYLPAARGKRGRMQNVPTDHAYGLPDDRGIPTVAVGRFPAQSLEDVQNFVAKVIRFEDQTIGPWTNRLNLWVGHPGGNSIVEKRLGETIVQSAVNKSLSQINMSWQGNCLIDFPNTPYSVARQAFRDRMRNDLTQGQCFTIYAGHSAAEGIWSEDQFVFTRDDWSGAKIQSSPGVVLTTGCFSCQMSGHNGKGFLTESILNPYGPVACLGAYAESYAAHGQLALDAFVDLVARAIPPGRLGDYWLNISAGIGSGRMDPLTFWLYDQADGSRGSTPLDKQRLEHLEMWTLVGDPALKIPFLAPTLDVDVKAEIGSSDVFVEFNVPPELAEGTCELHVDFRPDTEKGRSQKVKRIPAAVTSQKLETQSRFTGAIPLLKPLEDGELRVRVFLFKDGRGTLGVALKSLRR